VGLATFFLYIPVLAWIGIRDWSYLALAYALVAASVGYAWSSARMPRPPHRRAWITMCASALVIALFGRLFGPFVLPAGMAAVAMAISSIHPHILRHPWIPFVVYLAAALGPWGLEVAGVLVPSYRVERDGYLVMSNILEITPIAGQIAIAGFIASVIMVVGIMCMRLARTSQEVRAQIELQAWHLRQLVPAARLRRPATDPV
jgi:serine/threonine-protein kinase